MLTLERFHQNSQAVLAAVSINGLRDYLSCSFKPIRARSGQKQPNVFYEIFKVKAWWGKVF